MRSGRLVTFLSLGGLLFLAEPLGAFSEAYRLYEDPRTGFELRYPSQWVAVNAAGLVGFILPQEKEDDAFQENINLIVRDAASAEDPQTQAKRAAAEILGAFPDARIQEAGPATLAGRPACRLVFSLRAGSMDLKFMQVGAVFGGRKYLLTYTAAAADFEKYLTEAQKVVSSFKFPSTPPPVS